jgi:SAM-dependent methyltransferase
MTESVTMCGRHIHQAARALETVRNAALGRTGITFPQWKILDKAAGANRNALIHQLAQLTAHDQRELAAAVDELHERGLLRTGEWGDLELTAEGQVLRRRVGTVQAGLQAQLYDGISADELGITARVLDRITERARVLPGLMSPRDWEDSYATPPHWDLGRPQPAFRALAEADAFRGRVLDVGCGTGEHVLLCAALGLDATGIDVAPSPLRAAEGKARDRGLTARFLRHDVRRLAELGESFDTVLDCGLFHIFADEDRSAYVDGVRAVLASGGRYFMLCFSDRQHGDGGPWRLTRDDIITAFADGWRVDSIERTMLDSPTGGIHGWLVTLTKEDSTC